VRIQRIACGLLLWFTVQSVPIFAAGQDTFSDARDRYLAADYEGALAILEGLDADRTDAGLDVLVYRAFCFLALDRPDGAKGALRSIVTRAPSYRLPEDQVSPRMRDLFDETRRSVLPDVVQSWYASAKAAFDRRDPSAAAQFDRLVALLDDPDLKDAPLGDLRTVAIGFRDLSRVAAAPPAAAVTPTPVRQPETAAPDPAPPAAEGIATREAVVDEAPAPPAPAVPTARAAAAGVASLVAAVPDRPLTGPPDTIRVTSKGATPLFTPKEPPPPGVQFPLAVSQPMPSWSPRGMAAQQTYHGVLELTIDEQGSVTTVALQQAMQPAFDRALIKAARAWKFQPALLNGTPVPFVKVVEIQIEPDR
jgi:TonB family protein